MADAVPASRAAFIRKTYAHLAVAILGFIGLEYLFLQSEAIVTTALRIASTSWLIVLGGFMIGGWVARSFASNSQSLGKQYFGLALYVVIWALMFVPIMAYAIYQTGGVGVIYQAGTVTLLLVGGLTATVFITRKDFSFLRSALLVGSLVAIGMIVAGVIFGFTMGLWFSAAMVFLAAGMILYSTSNVLHHFGEHQYVSAALELFASIAMLFWYVLQLFLARR